MLEPEFSFQSQILSIKKSLVILEESTPWLSSCLVTSICVAIPAWSVPGIHLPWKPLSLLYLTTASSIVRHKA